MRGELERLRQRLFYFRTVENISYYLRLQHLKYIAYRILDIKKREIFFDIEEDQLVDWAKELIVFSKNIMKLYEQYEAKIPIDTIIRLRKEAHFLSADGDENYELFHQFAIKYLKNFKNGNSP